MKCTSQNGRVCEIVKQNKLRKFFLQEVLNFSQRKNGSFLPESLSSSLLS
jgi:hypothetical protein